MINPTADYEKAEASFRAATTPAEQLESLQEMLRTIPKHKSSEKAQSDIKRKISTLKKQIAQAPRSSVAHVDPYHIPPGGAGQVTLVGLPNTGKSSIVAAVSKATVKVADYPFSTTAPVPAMWRWNDVQIQLIDTPPITAEHISGGLVNRLRLSDIIAVVADAASGDSLDQVDIVLDVLSQRKIELFDRPAVQIDSPVPEGKPGLLVVTHADAVDPEEIAAMAELLDNKLALCPVDCVGGVGFEQFVQQIWRLLHVLRVYTKRPGEKVERTEPYTLQIGSTVEDLAGAIHRDLPERLKFIRIWGDGRLPGQQVQRTEQLKDKDLVEIHE
ncbi:MAG: 50S ribosome-binding GTPase [Planctomycetes bacterium]|nr:50S ribosome-binding GTPase [Planctomycetota bacterium]